ncbi:unnamed protein product [Phytophthora fragariaefolia]|uniref:Unnamed protein product n=1 Tax=Phytophthora fragariaefolia TaxID=1490495 RepID=A0A9W7CPZ2_9STRA|nr:unnamed protein product [Phytophthora fragariaefolia]
MAHQNDSTPHWATEYSIQQKVARQTQDWKCFLRPAAIAAFLAVARRVLLGPLALQLLFTATHYFSGGSVLIMAEDSFFAFTEQDMTMAGGCSGCIGPCKIVLLKYALFNGSAFVSSPVFNAFVAQGPVESLYDFTSLSPEAIALGESLDANGAVCQSGTNDWGATHNVATGTAQQILDIIHTLNLSVSPHMARELELSVGRTDGCDTRWSLLSVTRFFQFPTRLGDSNFGKLSAVDINVFPDYTECRPVVAEDEKLTGTKPALLTNGEDFLSAAPDSLTISLQLYQQSSSSFARSSGGSHKIHGDNRRATFASSLLWRLPSARGEYNRDLYRGYMRVIDTLEVVRVDGALTGRYPTV